MKKATLAFMLLFFPLTVYAQEAEPTEIAMFDRSADEVYRAAVELAVAKGYAESAPVSPVAADPTALLGSHLALSVEEIHVDLYVQRANGRVQLLADPLGETMSRSVRQQIKAFAKALHDDLSGERY